MSRRAVQRVMRRACLPAALVVLLGGCADAQPEAGSATGGAPQPSGSATISEELRIDGMAADLVPIHALAVAGDGTIAAIQSQDHVVRFFRSNGEAAGTFGGKGEGPGEFTSMARLGWLADTLWVLDVRQDRLTFISPEMKLSRTMVVPRAARPAPADSAHIPSFPIIIPMAAYPDGSLFAGLFASANQPLPVAFRSGVAYGRISPDGVVQKIVAVIPESGLDQSIRVRGSVASQPFAVSASHAISPDGRYSAVAIPMAEDADSAGIMVTAFGADGDTAFSRTYRVRGVPIPRAVGDSVVAARANEIQPRSPELAAAIRAQARIPKYYPSLESMLIGRDGCIWIQYPTHANARAYLGIDANGDVLGTLILPRTSRLAVAQRDRIWITERDENDVQSIVRYRVDW
jgi:hypothetical protein